ncbi:MAG: division/cell wall cluster transcriptional repressor MraZ, partial [Hungatella sp.]|nr:division/cell wall cluster transcriptional repressor MraZ [Hungatella sp.]
MFMGEYNHTVDAKGRLIVPSKFREQLGDEFVVTKGLDGCLFVYENTEWKILEEKLKKLPLTNANARKINRFFLAGAALCEVDKQGRILLPAVLREFAGIGKDAVMVGVGNRIEIW